MTDPDNLDIQRLLLPPLESPGNRPSAGFIPAIFFALVLVAILTTATIGCVS